MTEFGGEILTRRRAARMSQSLLAGAAQVSRSTVQRAERGLAISDESLRSICAVLEMAIGPYPEPAVAAPAGPPPANGAAPPDVVVTGLTRTDHEARRVRAQAHFTYGAGLAAGFVIFVLGWTGLNEAAKAKVIHTREQIERFERTVVAPDLPVRIDDVRMACAWAASIADCLEAKEGASARAQALWRDADVGLRRSCFATEQHALNKVRSLEACLGRGERKR